MSKCQESRPEAEEALLTATNASRDRITGMLTDYIELSAMKRAFEDTFGGAVLHNAALLRELVDRRRLLESAYAAIRAKLERGGYTAAGRTSELERDVRTALGADDRRQPDERAGRRSRSQPDEADSGPFPAEPDRVLDEVTRKRILRAFKRTVLPKVHADTSDTPFAVYDAAYSAYRRRDWTLMESFVIGYSGIAGHLDGGGPLSLEQLAAREAEYLAVERRMARRVRALRQTLTPAEQHAPGATLLRLERQGMALRRAIDQEAERMEELRGRLESLLPGVPAGNGAAR